MEDIVITLVINLESGIELNVLLENTLLILIGTTHFCIFQSEGLV